jgi:hypothetical protein
MFIFHLSSYGGVSKHRQWRMKQCVYCLVFARDTVDVFLSTKVKYIFRETIEDTETHDEYEDLLMDDGCDDDDEPSSIYSLKDGDEVKFGRGSGIDLTPNSEPHLLPSPLLCNIHLAISRAVQNTGVLDLIEQIAEDADDTQPMMTQEQFSEALTAKLVLAC